MVEVYLEELGRMCEEIQESKRYPDNDRACALRCDNYNYAKEMIDKIDEWLDDNVNEDERT